MLQIYSLRPDHPSDSFSRHIAWIEKLTTRLTPFLLFGITRRTGTFSRSNLDTVDENLFLHVPANGIAPFYIGLQPIAYLSQLNRLGTTGRERSHITRFWRPVSYLSSVMWYSDGELNSERKIESLMFYH